MLAQLSEYLEPLAYRIGAFAVINLLDDPALLALAFC
jgi:hypothetical protein